MQKAFIIGTKRTPIGTFLGGLSHLTGPQLSILATKSLLKDLNIDSSLINEVILGNVLQSGLGQNPARQVSLYSGLDINTPCYNINKVCASGMKSMIIGATNIFCGFSDFVLSGGFESMSNAPYLLKGLRRGLKFGDSKMIDSLVFDGLTDAYEKVAMGYCGEKTAKEMDITRELQDEFCINSYERALKASKREDFMTNIVQVENKRTQKYVIQDEELIRYNKERIQKLKPVFVDSKGNGTITSANASKLNDGACSIMLASEKAIKEQNLNPLAEIIGFQDAETNSIDFNICPSIAIQKLLKKNKLTVNDIDVWEINEAFSVTAIANMALVEIDHDKLNIDGGAVALGHPIGMSGARIVQSLITILKRVNGKFGIAAICNGGGGSSAILIKNV